ncbi:acyl-CoA Delta(11) desaturase-like [Aphis craccivora]|uniref:Acyl-CoA Delta(11) desaturase-like n=1 Tax=Aphis craccivora TaxID=307492 RepID=A0A6G0ZMB0_APHCR|nr:acyl-CoA Delta(11) desaturase-like [Aphis craccivora]
MKPISRVKEIQTSYYPLQAILADPCTQNPTKPPPSLMKGYYLTLYKYNADVVLLISSPQSRVSSIRWCKASFVTNSDAFEILVWCVVCNNGNTYRETYFTLNDENVVLNINSALDHIQLNRPKVNKTKISFLCICTGLIYFEGFEIKIHQVIRVTAELHLESILGENITFIFLVFNVKNNLKLFFVNIHNTKKVFIVIFKKKKFYFSLLLLLCFFIPTIAPIYFWNETYINAFHFNITVCYFRVARDMSKKIFVSFGALVEGRHNYHQGGFPYYYRPPKLGNNRRNLTYALETFSNDIVLRRAMRIGDNILILKIYLRNLEL